MINDSYTDGDLVIFRHPPDPVASFEIALDIPGRATGLTFRTPAGRHRFDLEVRVPVEGTMHTVVRVHGRLGPDGALQVIVEEVATDCLFEAELSTGSIQTARGVDERHHRFGVP
jgi:hypothetical protein